MISESARQLLQEIARRPSGATCRVSFVQAQIPIDDVEMFGEPYQATEIDREMDRLIEEHFKEDVA
jgi:hypothetical protein